MKFHISPRARLDLIEIWEYTFEKWSVAQADQYYKIVVGRFGEISRNPGIGTNYSQIRKGYRALVVKSHVIFYRLQENETIEIIRILHERMNFEHQLNK